MFSCFVRDMSIKCYLIFFYRKLVAMKPKVSLFSQTHTHYHCLHYLVTEENPKGIKLFRNKIKCEASQNSDINVTWQKISLWHLPISAISSQHYPFSEIKWSMLWECSVTFHKVHTTVFGFSCQRIWFLVCNVIMNPEQKLGWLPI